MVVFRARACAAPCPSCRTPPEGSLHAPSPRIQCRPRAAANELACLLLGALLHYDTIYILMYTRARGRRRHALGIDIDIDDEAQTRKVADPEFLYDTGTCTVRRIHRMKYAEFGIY